MEIIRQVLDLLQPDALNGLVLAAPVVNVFGFVNQSRYLPDRRDLNRAFPELFERENVLRVLSFVLGRHPASSTSFVSGVGPRSLTSAYGFNRDDWSYIPGGNNSGVA